MEEGEVDGQLVGEQELQMHRKVPEVDCGEFPSSDFLQSH